MYYRTEKISPTITRICSESECCYLVEGQQRAAMLDCCIGIGNISRTVRELTELPVILLLTHGHVDHLGGAMYFSPRYLNEADWELAKEHGSYETRKRQLLAQGLPESAVPDIYPDQVEGFLPLNAGDTFDLGGVTLRALPLAGHTPGSMAILHEQERTVLLGDACNPLTFLFVPGGLTVEEYRENLISFRQKYSASFDTVLFSHFEPGDKRVIAENIAVCDDIMAGRNDGPAFGVARFRGTDGTYIAKAVLGHPKERRRADGKCGNIVFSADRIFREVKK